MSRVRALTDAIAGNFQHLDASHGAGLEAQDRRVRAIGALVWVIDEEIAALKASLETFDRSGIDLDRAEAPARAMFDTSNEAILARKYESANERALFRTLRELREIQTVAAKVETEPQVATEPAEELGSVLPEPDGEANAEASVDLTPAIADPPTSRRRPDLEKLTRKGRKRAKSG